MLARGCIEAILAGKAFGAGSLFVHQPLKSCELKMVHKKLDQATAILVNGLAAHAELDKEPYELVHRCVQFGVRRQSSRRAALNLVDRMGCLSA